MKRVGLGLSEVLVAGAALAAPGPKATPLPKPATAAETPVDAHEPTKTQAPPEPPKTTRPSGQRLTVMQQQKVFDTPTLAVTSTQSLVFDATFGEGADRHVGVRAASALVKLGDAFVIAQDDSSFCAVWTDAGVRPLRLFADRGHGDTFSPARGNKAHKPDLELGATFAVGGREAAVLFGSGSTDARMTAAWIVEAPGGYAVHTADLASLYAAACQRLGLPKDALNLEGAAAVGDTVVFFQRGNGIGGVNASFAVAQATLEAALVDGRPIAPSDLRAVRRHALGALDGCALSFSDAAPLPDGRVLFLAAAEASPNTYDDGQIAGSVLGVLEHDGSARVLARVPDGPRGPYKLEGLAVERVDGATVHLRAVEDADDPTKASTALRLRLVL